MNEPRKYNQLIKKIISSLTNKVLEKMTPQEIATFMNVDISMISRWKNGQRTMSVKNFSMLMSILDEEDGTELFSSWSTL